LVYDGHGRTARDLQCQISYGQALSMSYCLNYARPKLSSDAATSRKMKGKGKMKELELTVVMRGEWCRGSLNV